MTCGLYSICYSYQTQAQLIFYLLLTLTYDCLMQTRCTHACKHPHTASSTPVRHTGKLSVACVCIAEQPTLLYHPKSASSFCLCSREDVARVLAGVLQAPPEHGLVFKVCSALSCMLLYMSGCPNAGLNLKGSRTANVDTATPSAVRTAMLFSYWCLQLSELVQHNTCPSTS